MNLFRGLDDNYLLNGESFKFIVFYNYYYNVPFNWETHPTEVVTMILYSTQLNNVL